MQTGPGTSDNGRREGPRVMAQALAEEDFVRLLASGTFVVGSGLIGVAVSSRRDGRHEVGPLRRRRLRPARSGNHMEVL